MLARYIQILLLCTGVSALSYGQSDIGQSVEKYTTLLQSLDHSYVDSIDATALTEHAIRAVLDELDPHSTYFTADQYKVASEPLEGSYVGLGFRFQVIRDTLTILDVIPNTPAFKANLQTGDRVVVVNDDTISGKAYTISKVTAALKAKSGSPVKLVLRRPNSSNLVVIYTSTDIIESSSIATSFLLDKKTALLNITRFSSTTLEDFKEEVERLQKQGAKNIIIDLRGNSGGYLNASIKLADEFLEDKRLIVYTTGLHQSRKEYVATSSGKFTKGKVAILLDEQSASASEVFAGALQDWDRAIVVGRRSFGKGLVQKTVEFKDGSAVRITTSRYFTPTGRSIQKPFDLNHELYRSEVKTRTHRGEVATADSANLHSPMYQTPRGRTVYGGGGISPDIFVAQDTAVPGPFEKSILEMELVWPFVIDYYLDHREDLLRRFPEVEQYKMHWSRSRDILEQYRTYCVKRNLTCSDEEFETLANRMNASLHEYNVRLLYGYGAMLQFRLSDDPVVLTALNAFDNPEINKISDW